jgi:hypothetical protein
MVEVTQVVLIVEVKELAFIIKKSFIVLIAMEEVYVNIK